METAGTYEELLPLIELCKLGKLYEVENWISHGHPISPPLPIGKIRRRKSPLQVAMDKGFHSLIQLLLENGAGKNETLNSFLGQALQIRRLDLVELLVIHGVEIGSVSVESVFDTWSKEIIIFFIDHGADLETGNPLAYALCERIRPALAIYKMYENRYPSFREQANIALRYHCKEGNIKWISLLLWLGADPHSWGPETPYESDPDLYTSALETALFYGHQAVLNLKGIKLDPAISEVSSTLYNACHSDKTEILELILNKGFSPQNMDDYGSSLIQYLLTSMGWNYYAYDRINKRLDVDTCQSREKIKMIHLLIRYGAKWLPGCDQEIKDVRRSLLKMKSDYVMEFIWVLCEYNACKLQYIEYMIKTPKMNSLLSKHVNRLSEIIGSLSGRD